MATVRKREWTHKGIAKTAWIVTYTDNGGKRRQKTFERKKDADAWRIKAEGEVVGGLHVPDRESVTLVQALKEYRQNSETRARNGQGMSLEHAKLIGFRSKHIERHLNCRVRELDEQRLQYLIDQLAETLAPETIRGVIGTLKQVSRFAIRRKWIVLDRAKDADLHYPKVARERYFPAKADLEQLLQIAHAPRPFGKSIRSYLNERAMICLGIFAGLRSGEMAGLQWSNVDFERRVIQVRYSMARLSGLKAPKTTAGVRDIPMSHSIADALKAVLAHQQLAEKLHAQNLHPSSFKRRMISEWGAGVAADMAAPRNGFVLLNDKGQAYRAGSCAAALRYTMEKNGMTIGGKAKFSIHALRHAAASLFIESGLPPKNIQTIMGHSSITMTYDVYGHLFPDDDATAKAVDVIGAKFSATRERHDCVMH